MILALGLISGALTTVWFALLLAQFRAAREGLLLEPVTEPSLHRALTQGRPGARAGGMDSRQDLESAGARWPAVCVVVPARNEGEDLRDCIASILAQEYPDLSVVIAEDRSEDDTPALADAIAAADSRVGVVHIHVLPDGWMGKSHALYAATRNLTAEWILFIDADCRLEPLAVRSAITHALREDADLLTLWPRHRAGGFWEHMLIPLCGGIIALWYGSPSINKDGAGVAFANGQFLMIRREAYERIGAHECVRDALIEDIPLAEVAKASGLRCRVASGQRLFSVRMYQSYAGIRDGWARIYAGALRSPLRIAISIAWLLIGSLLPYFSLPALLLLIARDGGSLLTLYAASQAGTHLLLMMIVSVRFWRLGGCEARYLLLYPVSVVLVMRILARAFWWLAWAGSVPWRNTWYRIDRHGRIVDTLHRTP